MAEKAKKLTDKERRFVGEYLIDLDARKAALAAGFSETVANSKAYQWVSNSKTKPHVYEAIQKAIQKRAEKTEVTQERVVQELARIGFSDIRKLLDESGELKSPNDWDDDTAAAVAGVEISSRSAGDDIVTIKKLKQWDKLGALEKLGRHLGVFEAEEKSRDIHIHLHEKAAQF